MKKPIFEIHGHVPGEKNVLFSISSGVKEASTNIKRLLENCPLVTKIVVYRLGPGAESIQAIEDALGERPIKH
jgi:hypothetical protein